MNGQGAECAMGRGGRTVGWVGCVIDFSRIVFELPQSDCISGHSRISTPLPRSSCLSAMAKTYSPPFPAPTKGKARMAMRTHAKNNAGAKNMPYVPYVRLWHEVSEQFLRICHAPFFFEFGSQCTERAHIGTSLGLNSDPTRAEGAPPSLRASPGAPGPNNGTRGTQN